MKKVLLAIMFYSVSTLSVANDNIDSLINSKKYENLPATVKIDNRKYTGKIPVSVYLMINGKEDLAIELLKKGHLTLGNSIMYKGTVYTEKEWAKLNGFNKFSETIFEISDATAKKEETIKRNRETIFTNMERLPSDIQNEKKLIKQLKEGKLAEILKKENKDKILINLLVKLIIDGNNDAAMLIMPHINDVNVLNRTGVSPLMASGFANKLDGGNVEFAKKLIFDYNANVNMENDKGMTAVHIAAAGNAYKTLALLIDNNANFMRADKTGKDPITYTIDANAQRSLFILHKSIELLQKQRGIN